MAPVDVAIRQHLSQRQRGREFGDGVWSAADRRASGAHQAVNVHFPEAASERRRYGHHGVSNIGRVVAGNFARCFRTLGAHVLGIAQQKHGSVEYARAGGEGNAPPHGGVAATVERGQQRSRPSLAHLKLRGCECNDSSSRRGNSGTPQHRHEPGWRRHQRGRDWRLQRERNRSIGAANHEHVGRQTLTRACNRIQPSRQPV